MATYFEPIGSSSGLHYEPVNCTVATLIIINLLAFDGKFYY